MDFPIDERKNHLVKYDNQFSLSSGLSKLSAVQQDLLLSLLTYFTREKKLHIAIPAEEIKKRAGLSEKKYSDAVYYKALHSLIDDVFHLSFKMYNGEKEWEVLLFSAFSIDAKTKEVEMYLSPQAGQLFFQIPGFFTQFELEQFVSMVSPTAKILFLNFMYRFNGVWKVTVPELNGIFGFKTRDSLRSFVRFLPKYLDEIDKTGYFYGPIKYDVHHNTGKRGHPIDYIVFSYSNSRKKRDELSALSKEWGRTPLSADELSHERPVAAIDATHKKEEDEELPCCPACGARFIKSYRKDDHTVFYGHPGYDSPACTCKFKKKTFSNLEGLGVFIWNFKHEEKEKAARKAELEKNPVYQATKRTDEDGEIASPEYIENLMKNLK